MDFKKTFIFPPRKRFLASISTPSGTSFFYAIYFLTKVVIQMKDKIARMTLELDKELMKVVKHMAVDKDTTVKAIIVQALASYIAKQDKKTQ